MFRNLCLFFLSFITCLFISHAVADEEKPNDEVKMYDITREISQTSPCVSSANAPVIEDIEANGPLYNESCYPHIITTTSYAGTCIAAPSLFDGNWKNVNNIPLENLIMVNCAIVDLSNILNGENVQISAEDIKAFERQHGAIEPKSFVIIYTGWSKHWSDDNRKYMKKYPTLSKDACDYLISREAIGVGIDGPTIDKKSDGFPIQDQMYAKEMFIIKNLSDELGNIKAYSGKAIIAPLKFENSNEAPVRVYLIIEKHLSFFGRIIAKIKGWIS